MLVVAPGAIRSVEMPAMPNRTDVATRVAAVVIDSQELFRAALGALLSKPPVMADVRLVSGCEGADALLLGGPADLVLCEVRSASVDGVRLARELSDRCASTSVILVAEPGEEDQG